MHSFLQCRKQRVKIGETKSNLVTLNGGMPRGTWLGPYVFIIYINDLQLPLTLSKFIDDVTVVDVITTIQGDQSSMQSILISRQKPAVVRRQPREREH